ncbi:MAG TPA: response regulator [Candidatus Saccharimonadales bacterium]|nr:response regulator [Candidatus Saccharimonadales bacterium]
MPKVLLVEDDNNLREIFEMRLQAEGYDTVTAGNGEEGLTVAMQTKPDLIISDVMMPKLSGFEMIENLRATPEGKDAKVIMMTALGQAEDRSRGEKLGVVKYLVKSQATLEDFARVIREVLPPTGASAAPATGQASASSQNSQESESKMPEEPTTPTNPATPAADPAPTPPADPMTPPATGAPDSGVSSDQQSTTDEQNAVQGQINDFVNNAPATDGATPPAADSMTPPAPATTPDPGTAFTPSAPVDNPVSTPGAPDLTAPAATTDVPVVPPATPPADNPPVVPPQTDAPAPAADGSAMPPAGDTSATPPAPGNPTSNAI